MSLQNKITPGSMKKLLLLFLFFLILLGCRHHKTATTYGENKFCIPDSLRSQIQLDTVRVRQEINELKLIGKITFDQDKVVRIYPLVSGIVTDVRVSLGTLVKKDQVLAVIKSSEMAGAENDAVAAHSNLAVAQKNFDAASDMNKSGILSEKDYTASQTELDKAKAELVRANTVLSIYGSDQHNDYVIRAPISGFIVEKFVNTNMQIRPDNNTNLFTISDLKKVWVLANVYESDISAVTENQKVEVSTISYPDRKFIGKIDKVYNVLDPDNKTMKVQIQLDNLDYLLKPEMFAVAKVYQVTNEKMLAVPAKSVIFDRNQYWVMVYRDNCNIETHNIEIVASNSTDTYVRSGVKEGDRVITSRQLLLYNAINQ
jgi:cobalt-zinc-cadmium efflux system membrane fusion protein